MRRSRGLLVVFLAVCSGACGAPGRAPVGAGPDGEAAVDVAPRSPRDAAAPSTTLPSDGAASPTGVPDAATPADASAPPLVDGGADAAAPDASPPDARETPAVVPVLLIDVGGKAITTGAKIAGTIRVVEDHDGTLMNIATRPASVTSAIGIRIRGNSSAGPRFEKKSFAVELRDDKGADRSLPLLGMPAESDWVLYACYSDKTCLRNAITYAIGREMGRYNVRTRFAEVVLDGKYHGLYLVVEKIKRDKGRLPIPAPAADATGDLTGGYIIKRDAPTEGPTTEWASRQGTIYTYHYPRSADITPAQKSYLRDHMDRFESMMMGADWAHPEKGYRAWIDVPSFADFMIIQELSQNVDGYDRSAFLYKQSQANGNKLYMGPLWDFDIAYGNCEYDEAWRTDLANTTINTLHAEPGHNIPFYWGKLARHAPFRDDVKCRWQELRKTALTTTWIDARIDAWTREIADAERRDHARWPVLGKKLWPNYYVGATYADEVKWLKQWIARRITWLDTNLSGTCR